MHTSMSLSLAYDSMKRGIDILIGMGDDLDLSRLGNPPDPWIGMGVSGVKTHWW